MNYLFAYEAEELMNTGKVHEAIELCKSGLKEFPKYTIAYSILANGYYLVQDYYSAYMTIEAALDRFPENKALLNLVSEHLEKSNRYLLDGTDVLSFQSDITISEKEVNINILKEDEVEKIYNEYKSENIVLSNFSNDSYVIRDFDRDLFSRINNFENLRDIIAAFKDEEPVLDEVVDYYSQLANKIGDGKIKAKQEFTKPSDTDEEPYIVSETMAQIYEIQKAYSTAIKVYEKLSENNPEKKEKFLAKIEELQNKVK